MTTVVDPKEVTKFNQIARSYWDPEGPMRAVHQINPLRIDFTESFYPLQDAKVLDVGCGGGLASETIWYTLRKDRCDITVLRHPIR